MARLIISIALVQLLLIVCFMPVVTQAEDSHHPYEWKFVCKGLPEEATEQVYYRGEAAKELAEFLKGHLGYQSCSKLDPAESGWITSYLSGAIIKAVEEDLLTASKAYARLGFEAPSSTRPTLFFSPPIGREYNLFFPGSKDEYMSLHMCGDPPDSVKGEASPLKVGGGIVSMLSASGRPVVLLSAAHELGHLQQANQMKLRRQNICLDIDKWIVEGVPDSIAVSITNDELGTDYHGSYSNKYFKRFFLTRPYYIPLNLQPTKSADGTKRYNNKSEKMLGYRTNGFWDFVTRRYLQSDASQYSSFYKTFGNAQAANHTRAVDDWLDTKDGSNNQGLEHAYPLFLAAMANWPTYRFQNKMQQSKWDAVTFDGCQQVVIPPGAGFVSSVTVSLDRYAGRCLDIKLPGYLANGIPEASLHIEALGQPSDVNELYLGWSKTTGTQNADGDCYDLLERRGAGVSPCLLPPTQGHSPLLPGTMSARYWTTDKLVFNGEASIRLIMTRVPSKHIDVGTQRDEKDFTLAFGVSHASLTVNGQTKNASAGVGRISVGGGMHAPIPVKGQGGGLSANMPMMMQDALLNRAGVEMPTPMPMQNSALYAFSRLQISEEMLGTEGVDESMDGVMLTLRKPIEPGQTGTFEVTANTQGDQADGDTLVLQDQKKTSSLTVSQFDRFAIRFNGTANLCSVSMSKLQSTGNNQGGDMDFCAFGKPVSMSFKGNIAFGAYAIGNNALEEVRTQEYDAYQTLRLGRIAGNSINMGLDKLFSAEDLPALQESKPTPPTIGDTVPAPDKQCDCSCEALRKMAAMEEQEPDPSKMGEMMKMAQCAMTCMMEFAKCE